MSITTRRIFAMLWTRFPSRLAVPTLQMPSKWCVMKCLSQTGVIAPLSPTSPSLLLVGVQLAQTVSQTQTHMCLHTHRYCLFSSLFVSFLCLPVCLSVCLSLSLSLSPPPPPHLPNLPPPSLSHTVKHTYLRARERSVQCGTVFIQLNTFETLCQVAQQSA